MVKGYGISASAKELVITVFALVAVIVILYNLIKMEVGSIAKDVAGGLTEGAKIITKPAVEYIENVEAKRGEILIRAAQGQVPANVPQIVLPILGEKDVYSVPSGASPVMGTGKGEADFVDIGFGMLVPTELYFYNLKIWGKEEEAITKIDEHGFGGKW